MSINNYFIIPYTILMLLNSSVGIILINELITINKEIKNYEYK